MRVAWPAFASITHHALSLRMMQTMRYLRHLAAMATFLPATDMPGDTGANKNPDKITDDSAIDLSRG